MSNLEYTHIGADWYTGTPEHRAELDAAIAHLEWQDVKVGKTIEGPAMQVLGLQEIAKSYSYGYQPLAVAWGVLGHPFSEGTGLLAIKVHKLGYRVSVYFADGGDAATPIAFEREAEV